MGFIKHWLMASRPKTLIAALVPIFVATALAYHKKGRADVLLSLFAFLTLLLIQIGTNLINDAIDFKKGADTSERLGFARVTQMGLLSYQQVIIGGMIAFSGALLCGIPLMFQGGWLIGCLLIVSILIGYGYTGGPYPLAYKGLGDLFVLLFFGFIATGVVYYLQTEMLDFSVFIMGAEIGLLATVLIAINNLRDVVGDTKAYKMTIPVRFGVSFAKKEIVFLIFFPFLLNLYWFFQQLFIVGFLPLLSFPLAWQIVKKIMSKEPGREYNAFLGQAALLHLLFGGLLGVGLLLA